MQTDAPISRRQFLKIAGRAGVALGMAGSLGHLVTACKRISGVSNTIATIGGGQTGPYSSTTTSVESGRDVRIGVVSSRTGSSALFGKADEWWTRYAQTACSQGVVCGDHKLHQIAFVVGDSGSDPKTAGRVAGRLISEARVDLITCSGSADLVDPVADRAEALGCPCLSSFHQWYPFVVERAGHPESGFKWTYAHAVGLEDIVADYLAMWGQVATNKKIGFLVKDDAEGRLWAESPTALPSAAVAGGYQCVQQRLTSRDADFYRQIAVFQRGGCDICCAVLSAEEFAAFWRQSARLGYRPKIATVGDALLFPQAVEAMGTRAINLTAESLWQPEWPFKDSITGNSASQLAQDYATSTGEQWAAPLAGYATFEWVVDVLKRVSDPESAEAIIEKVRTSRLDTCLGPIDFTAPIDSADLRQSRRPAANVYKAPVAGVQWMAIGAFELQSTVVANERWPEIRVSGKVQPLVYD